ncbi:MAG TPA: VOC family protein [Candidatus Faecaligallichristensenella faecipullorum]|nr:VOC family protein [Candidatus Faecaligallichristensenella faecipullorum]
MITGIGHAAYFASDMEAALEFYCGKLGFADAFELKHPETGAPWIRYIKVAPGQFIELFYGRQEENPGGSYSHLCLKVDDIQAIAAQMREKGAPLDNPPSQGSDGNWQCWTHDPDGNRIEFMQIMPDSLQSQADR